LRLMTTVRSNVLVEGGACPVYRFPGGVYGATQRDVFLLWADPDLFLKNFAGGIKRETRFGVFPIQSCSLFALHEFQYAKEVACSARSN